jgi:BirA family biotin operon repressor/biotin-[acetyl-CoA-carboxylase] ligase
MAYNESEIKSRHGKIFRVYITQVESTNTYAAQLLRSEGENFSDKSGFLVSTSGQNKGRGQMGNVWSSSPEQDLAMTWAVLKPPKVDANVFNMAAALSTYRGIKNVVLEATGVDLPSASIAVKWPNDVMFWANGEWRKVAGILVENQWRGINWTTSLVGIGVNVKSRRISGKFNAISISEAIGLDLHPESLEVPIIEVLIDYIKVLGKNGGVDKIIEEFNRELYGIGETRPFIVDGETHSGELLKINSNGLGEFNWKGENPPKSKLNSSEVQWVFGHHTL